MFKNLLAFWKGKDFLTNVVEDFGNMLEEGKVMFEKVCQNLLLDKDIPGVEDMIFEVDKRINALEKDIRKRIIEHLSIQPSADIPMCLLLMSVVKDAERIGDYAKNLYQVSRITKRPVDKAIFSKLFNEMDKAIIKMFDDTKKAFIESNEEIAKNLWQNERTVVRRCEEILREVSKSSFSANQAVTFTLIARYFKRTAAHLTNIATSVILPISELDFFDEKRRSESE